MMVRAARISDAQALAQIHVEGWQAAYRGQIPDSVLDSLSVERRANFWRERLVQMDGVVFVAGDGGSVFGFCDLVPSRDDDADAQAIAEIAAVYVHPNHWRQGIGRALCERAIARARSNACQAVTLWVLATNLAAKCFYERLGFVPDGATKTDKRPDGFKFHEERYRLKLQT